MTKVLNKGDVVYCVNDSLVERIEALNSDERKILEVLLSRLEQGREEYGPWNINDNREYQKEAFEEIIDALHYCAAALLKHKSTERVLELLLKVSDK
jgi:hypothetical protein